MELTEEEIEMIQEILKSDLKGIEKDNPDATVGSFKIIRHIPSLKEGLAFVTFREKGYIENRMNELNDECGYLNRLKEEGLPALNVYGKPFEVGGSVGMLVDYVDNAVFLDIKHSRETIRDGIIPAVILGVKLDSSKERWDLDKLKNDMVTKLRSPDFDVTKAQEIAKELSNNFKLILDKFNEGVRIGDLQILISKTGKVTIIDPVAVLDKNNKDVMHPEKPNTKEFLRTLDDTKEVLNEIITMCNMIATNPNVFKQAASGQPVETRREPLTHREKMEQVRREKQEAAAKRAAAKAAAKTESKTAPPKKNI